MRRRLFTLLSAMLLVLCALACCLFAVGFGVGDTWVVMPGNPGVTLAAMLFFLAAVGLIYARPKLPGPGSCRVCGYDLRATPDRCPECGTETKIPAISSGGDQRTV